MPKILINEIDNTSPGATPAYSNYSVLIAGFTGRNPVLEQKVEEDKALNGGKTELVADAIQPDQYGVYQFSSAGDFENTIGLSAPKNQTAQCYHYGNQMAYELLRLGYSIIYAPITRVTDLATQAFWEKFKDKASYDFRFVTHGLLASTMTKTLLDTQKDLIIVEEALAKLSEIETYVTSKYKESERAEKLNFEYSIVADQFDGFIDIDDKDEKRYVDYTTAKTALDIRKESDETTIEYETKKYVNTTTINDANTQIANLAAYVAGNANTGRGDCLALIELDEKAYTYSTKNPELAIIEAINAQSITKDNGKYCALTVPSICYKTSFNKKFGDNKKFPGAFHYLACFKNSLSSGFAEWYAAAGYTRGVSSYVVDHTTVTLGEIAINALEPRNLVDDENATQPKFACNVIANFRGSYYLWGNRTAHLLESQSGGGDLVASHFLNIRHLCTTIKKQLYVACRRFTFDPNSDALWFNFVNAIRPTLDAMKADQGIRDYRILKVHEDNPKKATLKAVIRIIPIEAVEDFDLTIYLEDSFGETAATAVE